MFTQIGICLMLITIVYLNIVNAIPASLLNPEQQDQKQSLTDVFGRFGIDPTTYLLPDHPYYNNDVDKNMILHTKRELKKKWAKFFQGSQSPYTIAFPALIRSRRSIIEEH